MCFYINSVQLHTSALTLDDDSELSDIAEVEEEIEELTRGSSFEVIVTAVNHQYLS